jgi:hypothetical protein
MEIPVEGSYGYFEDLADLLRALTETAKRYPANGAVETAVSAVCRRIAEEVQAHRIREVTDGE